MGIPALTQPRVVIKANIFGSYDSTDPDGQWTPPPPDAPASPNVTAGNTQLNVSWPAVANAATYDVIYNTSNSTSGATAFSGNPVSGTSATIAGLTNGTPYYVFVRATNDVGSSDYSASGSAAPSETEYTLIGNELTLYAPPGVDFGTKPHGDKPWRVWFADGGTTLDAELGRGSFWQGTFRGEISTDQIAPGSTQSLANDYFINDQMLSAVAFPHLPDSLVCFRRVYDAFTHDEAVAVRMKNSETTITLAVGHRIKGRTSNATGQVARINTSSNFNLVKNVGTVAYPNPTQKFAYLETVDIYASDDTEFATSLGTFINTENAGTFYTFNNKVARTWKADANGFHNAYMSINGERAAMTIEGGFGLFGGETRGSFYDTQISQGDYANQWVSETITIRHGTVNNYDARRFWRFNEKSILPDVLWRLQTDARPEKQSVFYQGQVSNGCEPDTIRYMDCAIFDDSEYHVFLVNDANKEFMLPPKTWNTGSNGIITAHYVPYLPDWTKIQVKINQVVVAEFERSEP